MSEFKDREITTTLDSGDKELSFSYSATGVLVDLLKEEYYIRTKTDEFVIKAVEKGEQFNKYTATLNVEELEGTPFRYGFKTEEQTIKECLEIAFNGTGWHIGKCNVAKKNHRHAGECYGMGCPTKVPINIPLRVHYSLTDKDNRHIRPDRK